jgi:hypothetical protein
MRIIGPPEGSGPISARSRRAQGKGGLLAVQPVAQKLAGLEERNLLVIDLHRLARAGVAADAGIARLDRERAEAAQFDPVALGQRSMISSKTVFTIRST